MMSLGINMCMNMKKYDLEYLQSKLIYIFIYFVDILDININDLKVMNTVFKKSF